MTRINELLSKSSLSSSDLFLIEDNSSGTYISKKLTGASVIAAAPVQSVAGRTGEVTLTKGDVGLSDVENIGLSTWAGSINITTLGTIATGTVPWANVGSKPTTISGFGITDAPTLTGNNTLSGANTLTLAAGSAAAPSLYPTGDPNTGIYSPGADQLAFSTGGTQRLTVDASGYLRLASKGIQFNGDTADANSLDDYEEGTWTPIVTSSSYRYGSYTKIGNRVIATAYIGASGGATLTVSTITGLPFTVNTAESASGAGSWYECSSTFFGGSTYYASGQCLAVGNTTTIRLSSAINKAASGVDGGESVIVTVTYYV